MLSDNAIKVLQARYLKRERDGSLAESPDEMFRRVAKAIARAELVWGLPRESQKIEEQFYQAMSQLLFLPNSPTLMNAGTIMSQLSACFVLPVEDHLDDIFTSLRQAALIQQSGGGTGFNFSHLRPKNDFITGTGGTATGPVGFMTIFDSATEHIKQGGKRRGANMGILNIDHPDIEEFIQSKKEQNVFSNFNISVGITDLFMHNLIRDESWNLLHPNTKKITKSVKATELWNMIARNAWRSGDPGLVFLDTINRHNPTPQQGKIEATNPCGEVPLLPYEACNLASINLPKFIQTKRNEKAIIDWATLKQLIQLAIRFLDNVLEVNNYLIPEIDSIVKGNRKVGLGVMGWAEALSLLEIPYDTDEAVRLGEKIMAFIQGESKNASMELARKRGVFKNWKGSIFDPHIPIRNATCTTIAPTGTISIIADTSSSIEPFFALAYERHHVLGNGKLSELNKVLVRYLHEHRQYSADIMSIVRDTGTLAATDLPTNVKQIFRTALEIEPRWHLKHQIAFQKFTDNAVSKTINLPERATQSDIDRLYKDAWKHGAKGITVFRYHAKETQVLHRGIRTDVKDCKVCIE